MVRIGRCQRLDPGSIPGRRTFVLVAKLDTAPVYGTGDSRFESVRGLFLVFFGIFWYFFVSYCGDVIFFLFQSDFLFMHMIREGVKWSKTMFTIVFITFSLSSIASKVDISLFILFPHLPHTYIYIRFHSSSSHIPISLVARIRHSHCLDTGSIPVLGTSFFAPICVENGHFKG